MYDVPWDVGFTKHNRLAIAVCSKNLSDCKGLSYSDMSENYYSFMKRSTYKDSVANIMQCSSGICVSGTMGTSYRPEIKLRVYPESFNDLAATIQEKMKGKDISSIHYLEYLRTERIFGSYVNGATSNEVWFGAILLLVYSVIFQITLFVSSM